MHKAWGSTSSSNSWKLNIDFGNAVKTSEKTLRFSDNTNWLVAVTSPYYRKNTCHQESMC